MKSFLIFLKLLYNYCLPLKKKIPIIKKIANFELFVQILAKNKNIISALLEMFITDK